MYWKFDESRSGSTNNVLKGKNTIILENDEYFLLIVLVLERSKEQCI